MKSVEIFLVICFLSIFLALPVSQSFAANFAPAIGTIVPSSGASDSNQQVIFTTTYSDADGWQNIQYCHLLISTAINGKNCFYGYYNHNTNKLYLRNDANSVWIGGFTPGSANVIENSYSKLNCAQTTVSGSGVTLTVKWAVTFKPNFTGTKNCYLYVIDDANAYNGWTQKGIWTIANQVPSVGTITPSSGASVPDQQIIFTSTYSDADGWQNIQYCHLLISTAINGRNCFYGYYNQNLNKLYMRNDANNSWIGGFAPGSANVIENSYTKLNCAQTTVSGSGVTLTVKWASTFKSNFSGLKNIYLYVKDDANAYNGWAQKGTWTITDQAPSVGTITPSSGKSKPDQQVAFTTTYSNPGDWKRIQYVQFLVNTAANGAKSFFGYYNQDNDKLYLRNDANTVWIGGFTPGSDNIIENSYVKLNCAQTIVSGGGTILTVKWAVTFKSNFTGTKNAYMYVRNNSGINSGWIQKGVWTITPPPEILTLSLPDGMSGEEYQEHLSVTGGTPPYTWSIEDQSLPDGLSLDGAAGIISGIPTVVSTFSFVMKITDADLLTDTQKLSIKISPSYPIITDEELLDQTEAKAALYFYNEALVSGFVKDADYKSFSSIAATGFGLASLCVMAERYQTTPVWTVTPAQARARVNKILDNCINYQSYQTSGGNSYGIAGFLYHFVTENGTRQGSCEVSTIDMAIFLSGAITAGEYFGSEVKTKANQIYNKMNWAYFLNSYYRQFSHGWFPDSGIMPATWDRPSDETMLISLLAIGANPDNQDILKTMYSWPRAAGVYGGRVVVNSYFGSMFTYFFAHCFFDFEKLGEDNPASVDSANPPINWWTNSVNAAYANRQFCIDNSGTFSSYEEDSWGITICEYPNGQYSDFLGAAPCESNGASPYHNGTIAPYGAISCIPLMRNSDSENLDANLAFRALRNYYRSYYQYLWGEYGPKDSFNHYKEFSDTYLGIDVGPEVLMIENYRSGLLWNNFMKNTKVQTAISKVFAK